MLSHFAYEKKTNFLSLLRAINDADLKVTRDLNVVTRVILFIPPETSQISMEHTDWNEGELISAMADKGMFEDSPAVTEVILNLKRWIQVIKIHSRYIDIYSEYPTEVAEAEAKIKMVSYSQMSDYQRRNHPYYHYGERICNLAYYDIDSGILHFNERYEESAFLSFEGELQPREMSAEEVTDEEIQEKDWSIYQPITPGYARNWLKWQTMYELLPLNAHDARQLVEKELEKERIRVSESRPGETLTFTPENSLLNPQDYYDQEGYY